MSHTQNDARPVATRHVYSRRQWFILIAVSLGLYITLLDVNILSIAQPTIHKALALSLPQLQWVSSAYSMTVAVLILPAGKLGDRYSRKKIFLLGVTIFILGSLLSSCSGQATLETTRAFSILLAGRFMQGLGAALLLPTGLSSLSNAFPGEGRNRAFGIYGSVTGLGAASAPVLGGIIVQYLDWQWIFLINIPIGCAALVFCLLGMNAQRGNTSGALPFDWGGAATAAVAVFMVIATLIGMNNASIPALTLWLTFALSVAALCLFIFVEKRAADPIVNLTLFRLPNLVGSIGVAFFINAGGFALFFFLTLYFQNILEMRPISIGLLMIPFNVSLFFSALLAGKLLSSVGPRRLMIIAMSLLAAGLLLVRIRFSADASPGEFVPGLLAMGVGIGLANAPVGATATGAVTAQNTGSASGLLVFSRQLGNAFGIAVLSLALAASYHVNIKYQQLDDSGTGPQTEAFRKALETADEAGPIGSMLIAKNDVTLTKTVQHAFVEAVTVVAYVAVAFVFLGVLAARLVGRQPGHARKVPFSQGRARRRDRNE